MGRWELYNMGFFVGLSCIMWFFFETQWSDLWTTTLPGARPVSRWFSERTSRISVLDTLPETNKSPWKIHHFDGIYQEKWWIFMGELLVSGRVCFFSVPNGGYLVEMKGWGEKSFEYLMGSTPRSVMSWQHPNLSQLLPPPHDTKSLLGGGFKYFLFSS